MSKFAKLLLIVWFMSGPLFFGMGAAHADNLPVCQKSWVTASYNEQSKTMFAQTTGRTCTLFLSVYTLDNPDKWDGNGFNKTAAPQTALNSRHITLDSYLDMQSFEVVAPDCGPYQVDLYRGPEQQTVTWPGGSNGFIAGKITRGTSDCESPSPTPTPTTTSTPTPTPSGSPTPTPTISNTPSPSPSGGTTTPSIPPTSPSGGKSHSAQLPGTGAGEVAVIAGFGLLLLLAGIVMSRLTSRRH